MHRQPKLQLRDAHLAQQKEKPFSYVRRKPRNGQIAKMGSFHQSKRSNNKWHAVEVRWGIFIENLIIFYFVKAVVNIPIQTLIIPQWLTWQKLLSWQNSSFDFVGTILALSARADRPKLTNCRRNWKSGNLSIPKVVNISLTRFFTDANRPLYLSSEQDHGSRGSQRLLREGWQIKSYLKIKFLFYSRKRLVTLSARN